MPFQEVQPTGIICMVDEIGHLSTEERIISQEFKLTEKSPKQMVNFGVSNSLKNVYKYDFQLCLVILDQL